MKDSALRSLPAVEKVLQSLGAVDLPRPTVVGVVRRELAGLRSEKQVPDFEAVLARIRFSLDALRRSRVLPVINGTGVIVRTNLGRSPLGPAVLETLQAIAANYSNLEFDLTGGERGGRAVYLEHNLALLCGAEAATVVNNCAAALVLILRHFTSGERKEVIISRGELIQIGGGFRIPEILEASGARLREVGTTNKTTLSDYSRAVGKLTAMILKVHRSNFFMGGFVESPATEEIAALQTTFYLYLSDRAADSIPALAMLRVSNDELLARASKIKLALEALPMKTTVGEGKAQERCRVRSFRRSRSTCVH